MKPLTKAWRRSNSASENVGQSYQSWLIGWG